MSQSLCTWYGFPVLPKVIFQLPQFGPSYSMLLQKPKPGGPDIPFTIGSHVYLCDYGSGELQGNGRAQCVPFHNPDTIATTAGALGTYVR